MSLEKHIKMQQDAIHSDITSTRDHVFEGLVTNLTVSRIPEELFVNRYLPAFMGNPLDNNWVVEWISIAGSPASEVDVFNSSTGETLYRVPPLMATSNVLLGQDGVSFTAIMGRFEQLSTNIPQHGMRFLNEALADKGDQVDPNSSTVMQQWQYILGRYNLLPSQSVAVNSDNDDDMDDFLDY
ncbi:putative glucuronate isomerase [Bacillus phage vB_BspM_AgentSmith]|nr:putative glucuronate isomerase [Bacillus phage vB_BspM_AgentSmith]